MAERPDAPVRRRGPDLAMLVVGLATTGLACYGIVGVLPGVAGLDPRWLVAALAVLIGVLLLVGSLRGRRGG